MTGGGSQLEGINDYAQIIFDSNVRSGFSIDIIGLDKKFLNPQFSQTIGAVFYNEGQYEVDFLKKSQKISKKTIFSRFSVWLDQYIWYNIQYIVIAIDDFDYKSLKIQINGGENKWL